MAFRDQFFVVQLVVYILYIDFTIEQEAALPRKRRRTFAAAEKGGG